MAKKEDAFSWQPGRPPPTLQHHSDAKLRLLEDYLDRYFETVLRKPQMDRLQITLVDAFSGGGEFSLDGALRPGSPLVLLDAVERATRNANEGRRKKLTVDAQFHFIDSNIDTVAYLTESLEGRDYFDKFPDAIHVHHGSATEKLPRVIQSILDRSALGRSIFFMDQCGYKDVPHEDVRTILAKLPKAEVIVTYAIGHLLGYLSENEAYYAATAPIELGPGEVSRLMKTHEDKGVRFLTQRLLGEDFQRKVGSDYMSRFFLRSEDSGRDMWFVHYSGHPTSKLVMNESHWSIKNDAVHQGKAGIDMLGFRPNWRDQIDFDFGFGTTDEEALLRAMGEELPPLVATYEPEGAITMDALRHRYANRTAATIQQIDQTVAMLQEAREIEVITPTGQSKQQGALLRPTHRLILPRQGSFKF